MIVDEILGATVPPMLELCYRVALTRFLREPNGLHALTLAQLAEAKQAAVRSAGAKRIIQ